jgi:hypothetical protein
MSLSKMLDNKNARVGIFIINERSTAAGLVYLSIFSGTVEDEAGTFFRSWSSCTVRTPLRTWF